MSIEWCITQKPDFLQAMLALPPKEVHQIFYPYSRSIAYN